MSAPQAPQTGICWVVLAHYPTGHAVHHVTAPNRREARRSVRALNADTTRLTWTAVCSRPHTEQE